MHKNWLTEDHNIHLPNLMEHWGYKCVTKDRTHLIYKGAGSYFVIIHTADGFLYYKVQRPQEKLSASNLIIEHVSKIEGVDKELVWGKVDRYYSEVLETKDLMMDSSSYEGLEKVATEFNHFLSYSSPFRDNPEELYTDVATSTPFAGRVFEGNDDQPLFPLFNIQNEVCGYFTDTTKTVLPYEESAIKHSLWYSNIPKSIEGLFLFKDPKEALAFHTKFQLKNVVYLALGDINAQTTDILFQIQRLTKVDKLHLSFTGDKKIEGYLRDLHFISYIQGFDFKLSLTDRDMLLRFPVGEEKSFSKFYDHTKRFNQELAKSFLKYNKIIDQNMVNKYSVLVSKDGENIKVRLPLETNAIKLVVWSYYKNYLNKTIEILKPTTDNWYSEWATTKNQIKKGKEVHLKEYRIAL